MMKKNREMSFVVVVVVLEFLFVCLLLLVLGFFVLFCFVFYFMKYISHQTKICNNGKHPLNFVDFEMLSTKIYFFLFSETLYLGLLLHFRF